ncbi:MAG TPA: 4-hydroxythreonine-4-phosphate dehydrogenase PdxA [Polyangiaceae bacterium]|nr:4-hydroxythreonine-4-phosphate dehydrogenase PdxA [Polyangiaceae bacterium]
MAVSRSRARSRSTSTERRPRTQADLPLLVVSIGCPAGIGPEVSVRAASQIRDARCVLVGDPGVIERAAKLVGVARARLVPFSGEAPEAGRIAVHAAGPKLSARDLKSAQLTSAAGAAQLEYIETAYALVAAKKGRALVTGPVSKAAIAHSGLKRARHFLGHTEWLRDLDGARSSVMCFASKRLVTSLVTTHVPLGRVPGEITPKGVQSATVELVNLLEGMGLERPRVAVASLNPHAGESELLGNEERRAIVPGIRAAARALGARAEIVGPVGAETAYRKAYGGAFQGVVAMYHDQATIPLKLVAFGDAVNVTMGLSVVRTSVDHGTAYDIAWKGRAEASGMRAALELAARLVGRR